MPCLSPAAFQKGFVPPYCSFSFASWILTQASERGVSATGSLLFFDSFDVERRRFFGSETSVELFEVLTSDVVEEEVLDEDVDDELEETVRLRGCRTSDRFTSGREGSTCCGGGPDLRSCTFFADLHRVRATSKSSSC